MYRRIMKSLLLTLLAALMATPAFAQYVRADIGPLHIRIAGDAPPPIRYERRPPRPARDYIWIGGYWDRRDERWEWIGGRWDRPADRRYGWVRPRYVREGRYWRYEPGHWSNERLDDGEYRRWRNDNRRRR
jgi:hypothetical protein